MKRSEAEALAIEIRHELERRQCLVEKYTDGFITSLIADVVERELGGAK